MEEILVMKRILCIMLMAIITVSIVSQAFSVRRVGASAETPIPPEDRKKVEDKLNEAKSVKDKLKHLLEKEKAECEKKANEAKDPNEKERAEHDVKELDKMIKKTAKMNDLLDATLGALASGILTKERLAGVLELIAAGRTAWKLWTAIKELVKEIKGFNDLIVELRLLSKILKERVMGYIKTALEKLTAIVKFFVDLGWTIMKGTWEVFKGVCKVLYQIIRSLFTFLWGITGGLVTKFSDINVPITSGSIWLTDDMFGTVVSSADVIGGTMLISVGEIVNETAPLRLEDLEMEIEQLVYNGEPWGISLIKMNTILGDNNGTIFTAVPYEFEISFTASMTNDIYTSENPMTLIGIIFGDIDPNTGAFNTAIGGTLFFPPIPGDVNGDGIVDIKDIVICALAFGSKLGYPDWNPQADINQDEKVDIFDLVMIAIHFGETL